MGTSGSGSKVLDSTGVWNNLLISQNLSKLNSVFKLLHPPLLPHLTEVLVKLMMRLHSIQIALLFLLL